MMAVLEGLSFHPVDMGERRERRKQPENHKRVTGNPKSRSNYRASRGCHEVSSTHGMHTPRVLTPLENLIGRGVSHPRCNRLSFVRTTGDVGH